MNRYPAMEKWLANEADDPADSTVWGHERQTFENLKKILKAHAAPATVVSKKGKEKEVYPDKLSSSPIPVEQKKAGEKKGKKKREKKRKQRKRKERSKEKKGKRRERGITQLDWSWGWCIEILKRRCIVFVASW